MKYIAYSLITGNPLASASGAAEALRLAVTRESLPNAEYIEVVAFARAPDRPYGRDFLHQVRALGTTVYRGAGRYQTDSPEQLRSRHNIPMPLREGK